MTSDQELISKAGQGDEDAFALLYQTYRDWVYSLAWRFLKDDGLAQDVVQETFTYLIYKLPTLVLTARLTTFLYPVVKNLSLNQLRSRHLHADLESVMLPAPTSASDHLEDLRTLLQSLPSDQTEVLLMRFVDDMALAEIATALKIPLGTVKSRLHHGLKALRENPKCRQYFLDL